MVNYKKKKKKNKYNLNEEQGLILRANERFEDEIPAGSDEKFDGYVIVKQMVNMHQQSIVLKLK